MRLIIISFFTLSFFQISNSQNLIVQLFEEIYDCQKQKDTLDNSPSLFKRVDKIKRTRNYLINKNLLINLSKSDTLFLIENFSQDIIEGQIWQKQKEPIKYIANLNNDELMFINEEIFSSQLFVLVNEWDINQIKKIKKMEF